MAAGSLATASVTVVADTSGLGSSILRGVRRAGRNVDGESTQIGNRISRNILRGVSGLRSALGSVVSGALRTVTAALKGLAAVSSAAGVAALAGSFVSLAAAAAPAAGALALIPTAAAAAGAAAATLAVALSGVGTAFEEALSGSAEEFKDSLEGLSGPVRQVATSLRALRPRLLEIRNAVQGSLFGPLVGELDQLVNRLGGPLQSGMSQVARQMGLLAREVTNFATTGQSLTFLTRIFDTLRASLIQIRPAIQPLLTGLTDIAVAVAPAFTSMASSIADAATQFGRWLTAAAQSGQAMQWVQDASTALSNMAAVAGNLVGTIQGVFQAATAGGHNALASLSVVTAEMEQFARSAQGQQALRGLFQGLRQVASALAPVMGEIATQIGKLAPVIAGVVQAGGPGLVAVFRGIGQALRAAGPGITKFIGALSGGLQTIVQSGALQNLGAAFGRILEAVSPLIGPLSRVAATLGNALAQAIQLVAPIIQWLATQLGRFLDFIRPITPVLLTLLIPFGKIIKVARLFGRALGPVIRFLGRLWNWLRRILPSFRQVVAVGRRVIQFFMRLGQRIWAAIQTVRRVVARGFRQAVQRVAQMLPGWAVGLFNWFRRLPARIWNFVRSIPGRLRRLFSRAGRGAGTAIRVGGRAILNWFRRLPGRIWRFITSIPGRLRRLLGRAVRAGRDAVANQGKRILDWFRGLPGKITGALGGLMSALLQPFRDAFNAVIGFVQDKIDQIVGAVQGALGKIGDIASKIRGTIGKLPGLANGGIVTGPTVAQLGEGGNPEVVIPLTRPQRARDLAEQSGLMDLLNGGGGAPQRRNSGAAGGPSVLRERVVNAPITVHTYQADGEDAARRVQARLFRQAGMAVA